MKPTIEQIMHKISTLEGARETLGIRSEQDKPINSHHSQCLQMRREIKAMIEEYGAVEPKGEGETNGNTNNE